MYRLRAPLPSKKGSQDLVGNIQCLQQAHMPLWYPTLEIEWEHQIEYYWMLLYQPWLFKGHGLKILREGNSNNRLESYTWADTYLYYQGFPDRSREIYKSTAILQGVWI